MHKRRLATGGSPPPRRPVVPAIACGQPSTTRQTLAGRTNSSTSSRVRRSSRSCTWEAMLLGYHTATVIPSSARILALRTIEPDLRVIFACGAAGVVPSRRCRACLMECFLHPVAAWTMAPQKAAPDPAGWGARRRCGPGPPGRCHRGAPASQDRTSRSPLRRRTSRYPRRPHGPLPPGATGLAMTLPRESRLLSRTAGRAPPPGRRHGGPGSCRRWGAPDRRRRG